MKKIEKMKILIKFDTYNMSQADIDKAKREVIDSLVMHTAFDFEGEIIVEE